MSRLSLGAEERQVLAGLEKMPLGEVRMHGRTARRKVAHFGRHYDYESKALAPAQDLPAALTWARERAASLAAVDVEDLVEALVTCYPPGASIGWHRDAPMFGSPVVGISLGTACRMRFERRRKDQRWTYELRLEPRSAYVLTGPARWAWRHQIPPVRALRYSITFRTLRPGSAD